MVTHSVFIYGSLMINDVAFFFFMLLFAIPLSSLLKHLFKVFAKFFIVFLITEFLKFFICSGYEIFFPAFSLS